MPSIFIMSGPSRSGKTTIASRLFAMPSLHLARVVSTTSRPPREREKNGRDYHFVSQEIFHEMILDNQFAEYAEVHGNLYGISHNELDKKLRGTDPILLTIDVQGARAIQAKYPAITIFIAPPSLQDLQRRMQRAGFPPEEIATRLATAREELDQQDSFDHIIINEEHKLERTVEQVAKIIQKYA